MSDQWNKIVHSGNKFWIIKQGNSSKYVLMKKPKHMFDNGHPVAHFLAISNEEALKKGLELAQEHGFKSRS